MSLLSASFGFLCVFMLMKLNFIQNWTIIKGGHTSLIQTLGFRHSNLAGILLFWISCLYSMYRKDKWKIFDWVIQIILIFLATVIEK